MTDERGDKWRKRRRRGIGSAHTVREVVERKGRNKNMRIAVVKMNRRR